MAALLSGEISFRQHEASDAGKPWGHLAGGYAGSEADYPRVPDADRGPVTVPEGLDDEQVMFPSDVFPTGSWR